MVQKWIKNLINYYFKNNKKNKIKYKKLWQIKIQSK